MNAKSVPDLNIERYYINTKSEDEDIQNYTIRIDVNKALSDIKIVTDSGNSYYVVRNGSKQNVSFVDAVRASSDRTAWEIDFHIYKNDNSQNKSFRIELKDKDGKTASDSRSFTVNAK